MTYRSLVGPMLSLNQGDSDAVKSTYFLARMSAKREFPLVRVRTLFRRRFVLKEGLHHGKCDLRPIFESQCRSECLWLFYESAREYAYEVSIPNEVT